MLQLRLLQLLDGFLAKSRMPSKSSCKEKQLLVLFAHVDNYSGSLMSLSSDQLISLYYCFATEVSIANIFSEYQLHYHTIMACGRKKAFYQDCTSN